MLKENLITTYNVHDILMQHSKSALKTIFLHFSNFFVQLLAAMLFQFNPFESNIPYLYPWNADVKSNAKRVLRMQ